MNSKTTYLICYDIREPARLQRVHRYLSKRAIALQYSVFTARLGKKELMWLSRGLASLIDKRQDDVRIYPLARDCQWRSYGPLPVRDALLMADNALPQPGEMPASSGDRKRP